MFISSFILSFFGIGTNVIVIWLIVRKKNNEIFKDFKQYSYLCAISLCNIFILIIQILSWMSECNETYDAFCPETHKYIPIQFLLIIFKETLLIAVRLFISNFFYVAFAFNRLSLIDKDHGKLVQFISGVSFKKYVSLKVFISLALSSIKVFKYRVNYETVEKEYPIRYEENIWIISNSKLRNAYNQYDL